MIDQMDFVLPHALRTYRRLDPSENKGHALALLNLRINSTGAPSGPSAAVFVPSPESGRSKDHEQFKKTVS
jgi:hypothetical protein